MQSAASFRGRLLVLLCVATLLLTAVPAFAASPSSDQSGSNFSRLADWRAQTAEYNTDAFQGDDVVAGQLLVTYDRAGTAPSLQGADVTFTSLTPRVAKVEVPAGTEAQVAAQLRTQPGVVAVEPVHQFEFHAVPDDEFYDDQWAHQLTGIEGAWDTQTGDTTVTVAVVDSGMFGSHPDLAGNIAGQFDVSSGTPVPVAPGSDNDPCAVGHGTWVGGIIGAVGNNGTGVAGVNWDVSLIDMNSCDPAVNPGGPTEAGIIGGIATAADLEADAVNLSLGGIRSTCGVALQSVIDDANAAGTVVVASSGNHQADFPGLPSTPASCNGALSVGAVGPDDEVSFFSVGNRFVDLVAPGGAGLGGGPYPAESAATEILTTNRPTADNSIPNVEYASVAGTSFSAPYVSGVVALLRAENPDLTPTQVEGVLEATAADDDFSESRGYGLVQPTAAVELVASGDALPEPAENPDFPVGNLDRVWGGDEPTQAIRQGVVSSYFTFAPEGAAWGVIARDDDYSDALAGSTLALGVAPVLFTGSEGGLAGQTADELTRVLPAGSTVYVLGGGAAVPAEVDDDLRELGDYNVVRLSGQTRFETAQAVSAEVDAIFDENNLPPIDGAVLARGFDWPDAITASAIGVQLGYPILVTEPGTNPDPENEDLHPAALAALEALDITTLITVGGAGVVTDDAERSAAAVAGAENVIRLGGGSRIETAIAVGTFIEGLYEDQLGRPPFFSLAVNVRRDDGYAHILASTPFLVLAAPDGPAGGVFIPVEMSDGSELTDAAADYARGKGNIGLIIGGPDLVTDEVSAELEELLQAQ
jgi:subtilisin family serine protease